MNPRLPLTGTGKSAPGSGGSLGWHADRACCCPAQPVVRVIMPPTPPRQHPVDLLLCGHHYRVSRPALAAARARIEALPGRADAAEAALLETAHRDHAEVR
jgi:hypothetical protein